MLKNPPVNVGDSRDAGSIPGEGNGNPLQHSCLGSSLDRGAWWATVHGVAELDTTEGLNKNSKKSTDTRFDDFWGARRLTAGGTWMGGFLPHPPTALAATSPARSSAQRDMSVQTLGSSSQLIK